MDNGILSLFLMDPETSFIGKSRGSYIKETVW